MTKTKSAADYNRDVLKKYVKLTPKQHNESYLAQIDLDVHCNVCKSTLVWLYPFRALPPNAHMQIPARKHSTCLICKKTVEIFFTAFEYEMFLSLLIGTNIASAKAFYRPGFSSPNS